MACANKQCGHRMWCEVRSREIIDMQECEEAKFIAEWWADKIAGRRDPEDDE